MRKLWLWAGLVALVMPVLAQDGSEATEKKAALDFDAGVDVRARYEFKDNWMNKGKTSVDPAYEDYYRFRTRFWGKAEFGNDYAAFLRLANEFRDYRNSTGNNRKNEFPDELFIDNLYFDFNNLADRVDLRIGRQDIREGAGRVISDGTPGDGSRSAYFDAILAKVRFLEKSDVDLVATWNRYRDDWTLGNPHDVYDNTKIKSGSPYSKMDEKGLMAYVHYNEIENFPMEFYWIWKQEDRFFDKKTRYPGRDFHTLGTRLMPKINEKLSAEVEAAVQAGQVDSQSGMRGRDILAWMTYTGLTYSEKEFAGKPQLTGAVLWMSGDTDSYYKTQDGSTDTGWNPVFNRTTWFSELCSNMYDQYRWSNLIYPHLEGVVEPAKKHKVKVQCGPMFAHEKDHDATSAYRGLYAQARYDFPLLSKICGKRGEVKGAVVGEALWYGDYYQHDAVNEDVATWLRFELNGKF